MDADKLIEFAPYLLVAFMFFWKNNVFVKQAQLEKARREIAEQLEKKFQDKYVEINAYKEFQKRIDSKLDKLDVIEEKLDKFLMKGWKDD